jgi:hypothetical protein
MEVNTSWEPNGCSATKKNSENLLQPNLHYSHHNSRPLVSTLSQINPVYISNLFKLNFNIIHAFTPSSSKCSHFLTFCYQNIVLFYFLSNICYTPYQSHPPRLDHHNIWWAVQIMKHLITQFSQYYPVSSSNRSKYSLQHSVLTVFSVFLP